MKSVLGLAALFYLVIGIGEIAHADSCGKSVLQFFHTILSPHHYFEVDGRVGLHLKTLWKDIEITSRTVAGRPLLASEVDGGAFNGSVYFYKHQDGSDRAIKVLLLRADGARTGIDALIAGNSLSAEQRSQVGALIQEYHAARLCEEQGGPKVYAIGGMQGGRLYLELERLFPEGGALSLKRMTAIQMRDLLRSEQGSRPVEEMADQFNRVLEAKVIPGDPDFMVSARGIVRWIDSGTWRESKSSQTFIKQFAETLKSIRKQLAKNPDVANVFNQRLRYNVDKSRFLSEEEKTELLSYF